MLFPVIATAPAPADELYWDANGTAVGGGGSGTWNTTDPFWSPNSDGVSGPYSAWDNSALDDAFFAGTAGTITLAEPITVHNMTIPAGANGNWIFEGETLTLGGVDPTINNAANLGNIIMRSVIAGSAGLTKEGGGYLRLDAANTFSGDINVNGGTLIVNGNTALGDIGNMINMAAGTQLHAGTTGGDLAGRTVSLGGGGEVRLRGAGVGSALFTDAGDLFLYDGASLSNDANDYTGSTTFFGAGTASFTSIADLGAASSLGAPTTVANGTIRFVNAANRNLNLNYIGDGDSSNRNWLIEPGGGTGPRPQLANMGTGTLTLTGDIALGGGSDNGPHFLAGSADLELLGVISSNNNRDVWFIADTGQAVRLGDANTFTGQAVIQGAGQVGVGTLADSGVASSLGAGSIVNIGDDGTLSYTGAGASTNRDWQMGGSTLNNDGSGALTLSGPVSVAASTATLGGSFTGADNVITGVISGAGNLRSGGDAAWVLTGANTYTGTTIVDSGVLRAGTAGAFGASAAAEVNGGTLDFNGFERTFATLSGTGGTMDLGSATLTLDAALGTSASYAGSIVGTGGLTKLGASTQTLTGANSYTGNTTIGGGTLNLDFSPAGGPASDIIGSDSALVMAGGVLNVIGAAGETNTQTFDGLTITAGNNTIDATSGAGGSLTVHLGAITRTGSLMNFNLPGSGNITTTSLALGGWATVNGTDYAKVEGGNILAFEDADYTDKDNAANWLDNEFITDVSGFFGTVNGSVQLGGLRYTQPVSTTVTVDPGQTLGVDGTIIVAPSVLNTDQLITGGMMTGAAGGDALAIQQNSTGNFTIDSQIVDNGGSLGFIKAGTGLVTLTNANNSYTGATTVAQGTLSVGNIGNGGVASGIGASSADSSNLVLEGATLQYTGGGTVSDRGFTIAKSGGILGSGIEVTDAGANLTFNGLVTSPDDANFTKSGAGTLTLGNGANDYVGITTVTGGLLSVDTLANGGLVGGIGASSNASANLVLDGGGLQYTGATTSTDRGFTLGTSDGTIDVTNAATTLTISGTAVGSGTTHLTKEGDGTLVLSGTNTYVGGNTVNGGTLRAGSTQAFGQPNTLNAMTLADVAGVTLDLNNFNNFVGPLVGGGANGGNVTLGSATLRIGGGNGNYSGIISGTGGIWRTSGGTQTFNGCNNTYTGSTTLQGANLSVDCLADGGVASGIGASSSASTNLVFDNAALIYTGGNVATDRGFQLLAGVGAISVANAATTLEFAGEIIGAGQMRKDGAGTLVLSGTNNGTGDTRINEGILRAGTTNAFTSRGMLLDNEAGVLLDLDGFDTTVDYLSGGGANGGKIELDTATFTLDLAGGGTVAYAGAISGSGGLVKEGNASFTQRLTGCDSSYTGPTRINSGVLEVSCLDNGGVNSSIGASSSDPANLVLDGGTLRYVGTGDSTDRQLTLGVNGGTLDASGSGIIDFSSTGPIALAGANTARTLTLTGSNTGNNTFSAQLGDNGAGATSLTKTGAGTWRLTNPASTYSGTTTISGGILIVDKLSDGGLASSIGASSSAAGNLVIGNGSTLRYVGDGDTTDRQFSLASGVTFIESSGAGALVFENTGPVTLTGANTPRTIALGGTNTDFNTLGGTIGDNGTGATTLAKNDSGTWILTGNNTFTGNTVINDGNLMIGNGGTTGNAGAGNVIVDSPTSTLSLNRSDTFTFSGSLSGPGTLAQVGTGTSVLTSATNTVGAATISAGTLQIDGTLTTPTIAMTGTSTVVVNGTVQAPGATPVSLSGDAGAQTIVVNSGVTLRANLGLDAGNDTVNLAGTLDTGGAALNLGDGNDTLILRDGAIILGAGVDGGADTDTLQVANALALSLDGASVANFETLLKQNSGALTLTGSHNYSAGTTIAAGTLQIGNGATAGALATPTVTNNGTLALNLDSDYTFAGAISGSGLVNKLGTGVTTLTGTNSYAGATNVNAGTLLINGDQSGAAGLTSVANGATLGGTGTIGGNVNVADGGTLSPGAAGNAPGELTINGALALNDSSNVNVNFGQANVPGGPFNDLTTVGGDLALDGTLNITETPGGTFGPGVYRIFGYGGSLTDNGLNVTDPDYFVQTAVANQVNLVNSQGLALSFWDGDAGPHSNSAVNGGDGSWRAAGDQNWTDSTGLFAAPFANASFAVFQGVPGTVTVDDINGQVEALGMQFATGGYLVQGDGITLIDDATQPGLQSIVRVGDGTAAGTGYVATIASNIAGATQLVKTDLGTLVLSGANSHTAGTAINGGVVEISTDGNLGAAGGVLSLDDGTLRNTAAITSARAVTLNARGGTFETMDTLALTGVVGGAGALTKTGAGTLVLTGANSYQGGTNINGGTVEVSTNANLGDAGGGLTFDGGTLHSIGTFTAARNVTLNAGGGTFDTQAATTLTLANAVGGAGALTKDGAGTLVLTNTNTYAGGTTISSGTLQLGTGGAAGSITGNVLNNGTLAFNRSDSYTFSGLISGAGVLEQIGSGTTILTADNSYAGATAVREGTLIVNGDQSAATGTTTVEDGGALGGIGTVGGDVAVLDGGALNPGNPGVTPGTLTINGSLSLGANATLNYNFGQAGVEGGAFNDLTIVHGDLLLDGIINVAETPGGDFGPGIYRVISYDGTLTDQGLSESSPDHVVQTSIAGQVNLVDISALTLNFWDGDAGPKNDSLVAGGDGVWRAAGDDNWTDQTGDINAAFSNSSFAIFAGAAGTVDVDNTSGQVQASGMQFATDGYLIQGESIALVGPESIIRVGDGTAPGAAFAATIASVLEGNSQLVKDDLGTLVLTGANTYTGGTLIDEGTLQISSDANLGGTAGGLAFDGGVLRNTVAVASARGVTLNAAGGTFRTDAGLTLSGVIGGAGGLTKTGSAALILTGANSYVGPTTVAEGSLYVDGDQSGATGPISVQSGALLGGMGTIGGDVAIDDGGILNPGSADGTPGTLAIAGNLTLSSGSVMNYSFGETAVAGGALNDLTTVGGNLVLDGTLNITETSGGTFGPGIYRIFDYAGTLTDNGLSVGTIPSAGYFVQTAVANQVNLVNTDGLTLNYWDGAAGPKFDSVVQGGDGVWQNSTGNDNWADSTGVVNAAFTDASFAIFSGMPGTVTVDNGLGQVTASGMQFAADGYVIEGGPIGLDGAASTIRVGDGTTAGAGMTATIASNLTGASQLVKTDQGTLVLTGANSYSGGTQIVGGTLQVSSDVNLGAANGLVNLSGGTLHTAASFDTTRRLEVASQGTVLTDAGTTLTWNGSVAGNGTFTKAGGGTMVLTSDSTAFAGTTAIDEGTLFVAGSLCGAVNVLSGGRLSGTGTVCDTTNESGGMVAPGNDGTPGTLTIAGNYIGNGGVIEIESALGGDSSPTDRLVVTGNTSGTGSIRVANLGGGGQQTNEGIKIVDVGGASDGSFSLAGDYTFEGEQAVIGGAFAYRLYKGGLSTPADGDWYLRSTYLHPDNPDPQPLYAPGTPIYEAYPGVLQGFNELGTLQQRVGNRFWGPGMTPQGMALPNAGMNDAGAIWGRIEATHTRLDPEISTTGTDYNVNRWMLQAGTDGLLFDNEAGSMVAGVTAHYGTISSGVSSIFGTGAINATGYGLGGTLTWYGQNGFYADGQARATWYDSDLTSGTLGTALIDGNNAFGYAFSLEAGQRIAIDERWSLTPQVQLAFSSVDFDDFTDPYGAVVSLQDGDRLVGRLGLSADYEDEWTDDSGQKGRTHIYAIANLYYDFLDGSDVDVSGTSLVSDSQAPWAGVGLGGSLSWADGNYAIFGEASARGSLENFGDNYELSAKIGLNVKW